MEAQKTAMLDLIEAHKERIKFLKEIKPFSEAHAERIEMCIEEIQWCIDKAEKRIPTDRDQIVNAYETGMIQGNHIDNDHEDDCECEECVVQSQSMANDYYNKIYGNHE